MDDSFRLVTNERMNERTNEDDSEPLEERRRLCVSERALGEGSDEIEYAASIILFLKIFEQGKEL